MPSEIAKGIAYAVLAVDADQPSPEVAIDAELQEVREVLDGLRGRYVKNCWCDAGDDAEHYVSCQRARALMERMEIR